MGYSLKGLNNRLGGNSDFSHLRIFICYTSASHKMPDARFMPNLEELHLSVVYFPESYGEYKLPPYPNLRVLNLHYYFSEYNKECTGNRLLTIRALPKLERIKLRCEKCTVNIPYMPNLRVLEADNSNVLLSAYKASELTDFPYIQQYLHEVVSWTSSARFEDRYGETSRKLGLPRQKPATYLPSLQ